MNTINPIQTLLLSNPTPSNEDLAKVGYKRAVPHLYEPYHMSTHLGATITSGFKVRSICVRSLRNYKASKTRVLVECPGCHKVYLTLLTNIFRRRTVTCGCKRNRRVDPVGEVYGELEIISRVENDHSGTVNVLVRCPKGHEGKRKYSRLKRMGPRAACTVCHPYQGPGFQLPTV